MFSTRPINVMSQYSSSRSCCSSVSNLLSELPLPPDRCTLNDLSLAVAADDNNAENWVHVLKLGSRLKIGLRREFSEFSEFSADPQSRASGHPACRLIYIDNGLEFSTIFPCYVVFFANKSNTICPIDLKPNYVNSRC